MEHFESVTSAVSLGTATTGHLWGASSGIFLVLCPGRLFVEFLKIRKCEILLQLLLLKSCILLLQFFHLLEKLCLSDIGDTAAWHLIACARLRLRNCRRSCCGTFSLGNWDRLRFSATCGIFALSHTQSNIILVLLFNLTPGLDELLHDFSTIRSPLAEVSRCRRHLNQELIVSDSIILVWWVKCLGEDNLHLDLVVLTYYTLARSHQVSGGLRRLDLEHDLHVSLIDQLQNRLGSVVIYRLEADMSYGV